MPRVFPRAKLDKDAVYVCWMGHATAEHNVPAGTRLLGDHPAVRSQPWYFAPDGSTLHESNAIVPVPRKTERQRPTQGPAPNPFDPYPEPDPPAVFECI